MPSLSLSLAPWSKELRTLMLRLLVFGMVWVDSLRRPRRDWGDLLRFRSVLEEGRNGWRLVEHNAGTLPEPVLSDDRAVSDS